MITEQMVKEAKKDILTHWGYKGKNVIEECAKVTPFNDGIKAFLNHCQACGGDWGGMFLVGIRNLYPSVWDAIPDDMGSKAFLCICSTLILCGVDTSQ